MKTPKKKKRLVLAVYRPWTQVLRLCPGMVHQEFETPSYLFLLTHAMNPR